MIKTINKTQKTTNFELNLINTSSGFVDYFKLVIKLYNHAYTNRHVFSRFQKFKVALACIIKTPYWVLIKPWGQFFSVHKKYMGTITLTYHNDNISNVSFREPYKRLILKFCGIPFWYYSTCKFNAKEQQELTIRYTK